MASLGSAVEDPNELELSLEPAAGRPEAPGLSCCCCCPLSLRLNGNSCCDDDGSWDTEADADMTDFFLGPELSGISRAEVEVLPPRVDTESLWWVLVFEWTLKFLGIT